MTCAPNQKAPPHHYDEAETAAFVISGYVRVYYGDDFKEYVEAGSGDYLFAPVNIWHIEENPYYSPSEQFLTRGPGKIVVNME